MFWDKLESLCSKKGISPTAMTREIGISQGNIPNWKKGGFPQKQTLLKIAQFFSVQPEFFYGKEEPNAQIISDAQIAMIPIYESVSAGLGAFASNYITDYMPICFSKKSEIDDMICVKVSGDSMYPIICDGDTILVHRQEDAENGQIAVCLIDGEDAVVKQLFVSEKGVELRSVNTQYAPRWFRGADAQKVKVSGIVKKVIREL